MNTSTPIWIKLFVAILLGSALPSAAAHSTNTPDTARAADTGEAADAEKADVASRRAQQSLAEGDYAAAVARFGEAIRLAPKDAKFRGLRGVARLRLGDYARGTEDLRAAIELNPGDAGLQNSPPKTPLADEAFKHGRRQVEQMLRDRPAMARPDAEAGFLRDFAARKFAGEDLGSPIDWDPTPPLHSDAEHLAPNESHRAAILVAPDYTDGPNEGKPRPFEELWAGAIYELHNVAFAREFVRIHAEAEQGKVSKEAFVAEILRYELMAAQRTRAFYVRSFLPWAEKKKFSTDPMLWFCGWWASPENALQQFTDKSTYPWHPYARMYDWATVHRHWRHGKTAQAEKLLESMRVEEGYGDEASEVFYWIGRCRARLDRPTEAIAAFDEAIRLDPRDAAAHRARGELYEKLGEKEKARADFAKAKELEAE